MLAHLQKCLLKERTFMVKWLTDNVGTDSYNDGYPYCKENRCICLDVRDLVDKRGNTHQSIAKKIEEGVKLLQQGNKVIVCCDYGMSRSNSLAVGIISKYKNRRFDDVVKDVLEIIGEGNIKIEVLNMVHASLVQEDVSKKESTILVTGASGFIGSGLIAELSHCGYECVPPSSTEINLEEDLIRLELLVKRTKPSQIVHLASPRIYTCNAAMGKSLGMLKNILDICLVHDIKLVYPSNWEVYSGYASEGLLASENLPLFAKGTYGETKFLCEQLIREYGIHHNLSYLIMRFSTVFGAQSDRPKFIYNLVDKILKNQSITTHLYKNGSPQLDLLFIEDAVTALSQAIVQNLTGEYNIGTGQIISTKRVAELITETANSSSVILYNNIDEYAPNIIMDASKFKRKTGWKATTCFETWMVEHIKSIMYPRLEMKQCRK